MVNVTGNTSGRVWQVTGILGETTGTTVLTVAGWKENLVKVDSLVKSRHSRLSGIFPCSNTLKNKDSGQAGMTGKWCFSTFYEIIKVSPEVFAGISGTHLLMVELSEMCSIIASPCRLQSVGGL